MPANGVPEPAQPKEAAPGVQIIEKKPAAAPAAPSAAPAAPPAPAMAVVDVGAINRAAQQQVPAQPRKLNIFCNLPFSIANMRHFVFRNETTAAHATTNATIPTNAPTTVWLLPTAICKLQFYSYLIGNDGDKLSSNAVVIYSAIVFLVLDLYRISSFI